MKKYCIFALVLIFTFTLNACKKEEDKQENDETAYTETNQSEITKMNMNELHKIYGSVYNIEDVYGEDVDIDDFFNVSPLTAELIIKLNQQNTEKNVFVKLRLNEGVEGKEIIKKDENISVGDNVVVEYYGEWEECPIDYLDGFDVEAIILYDISNIKSLRKVTDGEQ